MVVTSVIVASTLALELLSSGSLSLGVEVLNLSLTKDAVNVSDLSMVSTS